MATYTSPEDEQFFAAIGRLTISWGHLEFAIDCMVQILRTRSEAQKIETEAPRSLQRKISFLRAVFRQLPLDADTSQRWLRLLDKVQSAAQRGHDIIHGVVIEHKEKSGEARFVRIIRKQNKTFPRHITESTTSVLRLANYVNKLSRPFLSWLDGTIDLLHEPQRQHDEQNQS